MQTHIKLFKGQKLICIKLHDKLFVVMKPVVESLGLSWKVQHRKLTSGKFAPYGKLITINIDTQMRKYFCIPLNCFFSWMMTIHVSKVKPEMRANIIAYQQECDDKLNLWLATVNEPPAYSSESLARLIDDAIDKELPFIKKPHLLDEFLSKRNNTSRFDFEGILSVIIKIFEQALADLSLTLNPAEKGEAIESLFIIKLLEIQRFQQFGLLAS